MQGIFYECKDEINCNWKSVKYITFKHLFILEELCKVVSITKEGFQFLLLESFQKKSSALQENAEKTQLVGVLLFCTLKNIYKINVCLDVFFYKCTFCFEWNFGLHIVNAFCIIVYVTKSFITKYYENNNFICFSAHQCICSASYLYFKTPKFLDNIYNMVIYTSTIIDKLFYLL